MYTLKFYRIFSRGCLAAILLASALAHAGCASHRARDGYPILPAPVVAPVATPEPAPSVGRTSADAYVLQSGDRIVLTVFREPELSGEFQVDATGAIRHSLLGPVNIAGLTIREAESVVTTLLEKDYLVNPRVMVQVQSATGLHVVLLGEVKRPGVMPIPTGERLTLLEAVAQAGGFTDLASPNRVRIVREVNGKNESISVRVGDLMAGKGRQQDVVLEPNDVITIPEVRF